MGTGEYYVDQSLSFNPSGKLLALGAKSEAPRWIWITTYRSRAVLVN